MNETAVGVALVSILAAIAGFIGWWLNKQREATSAHTEHDMALTNAMIKMIMETHAATKEIGDAVNNRHEYTDSNGETPRKLFDQITEQTGMLQAMSTRIHQLASHDQEFTAWMHGYKGSELSDAEKVNSFVQKTNERLDHHSDRLKTIQERIDSLHKLMEEKHISAEEMVSIIDRTLRRAFYDRCGEHCKWEGWTPEELVQLRDHLKNETKEE